MAVEKIVFPYFLPHAFESLPKDDRSIIFFGADFYNLPEGSDQKAFIEESNRILDYIRKSFPRRKLFYQAHPNEADEYKSLNLLGFIMGERTVGEVLMYDKAVNIEYVFSVLSGASISAYAMGLNAAVFIDRLHGIIPEEAITGYRSYFSGLPDYFFITELETPPVMRKLDLKEEESTLRKIKDSIKGNEAVTFLVGDPGSVVKAAVIAENLKKENPERITDVVLFQNRRWHVVDATKILSIFDTVIRFEKPCVRYSARPQKIIAAIEMARYIKKLPIKKDTTIVSFSNMIFEENCILSYHKNSRKICLIENRWYDFTFNGGYEALPKEEFRETIGQKVFKYIFEPLLGLQATVFLEHKDGKVINYFRYKKPLEEIYNETFVLMPFSQKNA